MAARVKAAQDSQRQIFERTIRTMKTLKPAPPIVECAPPTQPQARHLRSLTEDKYVRGIDVSSIQGDVNWHAVLDAPERLTFAIFKATDGTRGVDPKAARNKKALLDLRGELVAGCYHVTHPKPAPGTTLERDAEVEAERCAEWTRDLAMPPAVDFELNELTPERQAAWLKIHLETLTHLIKRKPILYTGAQMQSTLTLCSPWIREYPLWIANYPQAYIRTSEAGVRIHGPALTFDQAEARAMPKIRPWANATGWQFSGGGTGLPGNFIKGSNGFTDCNIFGSGAWVALFA
jgi:GH25 family lysozyme M1 (1,4-beta-N-acetylmuramidase)